MAAFLNTIRAGVSKPWNMRQQFTCPEYSGKRAQIAGYQTVGKKARSAAFHNVVKLLCYTVIKMDSPGREEGHAMKGLLLAFCLLPALSLAGPLIYEKHYHGFTVWLDCTEHGAVAFRYDLDTDQGDISREGVSFIPDPSVPAECQPSSGDTFSSNDPGISATGTFDRGHLVPANHMDNDLFSITDSFFATNILPQQSTFNRQSGAWFLTEKITECYRDIAPLTIWGGVIWGDNTANDFFTGSHGVKTPEHWWKPIYLHDTNDFIAWIFPNDKTAKDDDIDDFIVTISELKSRIKYAPDFGVIEQFQTYKPAESWKVGGSSTLTCEGLSTSNG
jgi:endonuclease G